jgi:hypothetical protein
MDMKMLTLRTLGVAAGVALLVGSSLPACTSTANVSDVWMSLDEDGGRRRKIFYTDSKAIYCIAEVSVGRNNATLEMQLHRVQAFDFAKDDFSNVDVITEYMELRPDVTKDRPAKIALKVVRTSVDAQGNVKEDDDAAFLPGRMICEVRLDGVLEKTAVFNIDFPECPQELIRNGEACFGFYKNGVVCPESGAKGAPEPTCKCTEKGWEC